MTWVRMPSVNCSQVVRAEAAGFDLLVVFGDGRWWAFENRCSHAGCAFSDDGEIDGLIAICDCHGSEFDVRTGRPLRAPATEPIRTFPVRSADGQLEVDVD